jgi:hypothetical protein
MNDLYRLVTEQEGGAAHVSSTLMTLEEAYESLKVEAWLARKASWSVHRVEEDVLCTVSRNGTVRRISVRKEPRP